MNFVGIVSIHQGDGGIDQSLPCGVHVTKLSRNDQIAWGDVGRLPRCASDGRRSPRER